MLRLLSPRPPRRFPENCPSLVAPPARLLLCRRSLESKESVNCSNRITLEGAADREFSSCLLDYTLDANEITSLYIYIQPQPALLLLNMYGGSVLYRPSMGTRDKRTAHTHTQTMAALHPRGLFVISYSGGLPHIIVIVLLLLYAGLPPAAALFSFISFEIPCFICLAL